jgi:hypothetical protein
LADGDTVFAPPLKDLLLRAIDIARRREELYDNSLYQYRCRLDRDLDELVTRPSDSCAGCQRYVGASFLHLLAATARPGHLKLGWGLTLWPHTRADRQRRVSPGRCGRAQG